MEPRTAVRGNADETGADSAILGASMEPRTAVRGNVELPARVPLPFARFNGATHGRAWKHPIPVVNTQTLPCFNGATHGRAWKPNGLHWSCFQDWLLQWSHARPCVETILSLRKVILSGVLQ